MRFIVNVTGGFWTLGGWGMNRLQKIVLWMFCSNFNI
jgi:hypothetical protein